MSDYLNAYEMDDERPDGGQETPVADESDSGINWGGVVKTVGAVASAFNPLVGAVISALSPLAQEKITKEVARHTDNTQVAQQIGSAIMTTVTQLTGKLDPIDAVAEARKNPDLMTQVEQSVVQKLNELAPILDRLAAVDRQSWDADEASRTAAAQRALAGGYDNAPILTRFAIYGIGGATMLVGALLGVQVWFEPQHRASGELLTLLITMVTWVLAKGSTLFDNRFGTSHGSAAKDAILAELSRKGTK